MRVTLEKNQHHAQGNDAARVVCTLPGYTLHIAKTGPTLDDAAITVLNAMESELQRARTRRSEVVKTPNPRPRGRIVRLFTDRGYGFIETEARREVYFHAHAVQGIAFANLAVGMVVDLDIEAGHQGPQASRVTLRR
jgi:cold shock CspA family protein